MLPGYFLWGKGEGVMWFIPQNNCAADIIIQIWLRNLFTLFTSSAGKTNHQGTHILDEGCTQARATTHQRAEEEMHTESVQHYLKP